MHAAVLCACMGRPWGMGAAYTACEADGDAARDGGDWGGCGGAIAAVRQAAPRPAATVAPPLPVTDLPQTSFVHPFYGGGRAGTQWQYAVL